MTATLASHILDAIRDHLELHVGFCQWTRDDGASLWVCSARDRPARILPWHAGGYGGWSRGGCTESRSSSERSPT